MYSQIKFTNSLKRKFPIPESNKERALAVILIGIAILIASIFDPVRDYIWRSGGDSAQAQFVRTEQFRNSGPKRLQGVYEFGDDYGGRFEVTGKRIFNNSSKIPKQVEVIWHLGEPQKARISGDYSNRIIPAIIGILVTIAGLYIFIREKRKIGLNK